MVGFAMVIFESHVSSRAFKRGLEKEIITDLAGMLLFTIVLFLIVRLQDLVARGMITHLFTNQFETYFFWIENLLFIIPLIQLLRRKFRIDPNGCFYCAIMVVCGVILNRFNVSIVGMTRATGEVYLPSPYEITISLFLVTLGVIAFGLAVKYLPIFPEVSKEESIAEKSA
jgi:Ni/Fe-hydrogenase subunit HybB-like protein